MPSINELRTITVRADADTTGYVREMGKVVDVDKKAVASNKELNNTLQETEQKLNDTGSAADRFKRIWVDGVRDIQGYNKAIRDLNRFYETGKITDRERALALENINRKYATFTNTINDNTKAMHSSGQGSAQMQRGMLGATQQSRAMQFAVQNLGFQINDAATQIASGTGVFQVFAQQAGQFVQVFQQGGGVRNVLSEFGATLRGVLSAVSPLAIGLTALGATLGGAVIHAFTLDNRARSLNATLEGMGTSSLESAKGLELQVKRLREMGIAATEARSSLDKVITTSGINPARAEAVVRAGANLGVARRVTVEAGTEELLTTIRGGSEAVLQLGLQLDKITPKEAALNRQLREQKGEVEALEQAFGLLSDRLEGLHKKALSPTDELLKELSLTFSNFMDDIAKGPLGRFVLDEFNGILAGIKGTLNEINAIKNFIQSIPKPPVEPNAVDWRAQRRNMVIGVNPQAGNYPAVPTTLGVGGALSLISQYESRNRALIGTGENDLSGYPLSATGFPMWPGIPTRKGPSTAAGLYQITRSTWDPIARQLGISDFSERSQTQVAEELFRTRGFQPWAPHNPRLRQAIGDLSVSEDLQAPVFRESAVQADKYEESLRRLNKTGEDTIRITSAHAAVREAVTAKVQAERAAIEAGQGQEKAAELGRRAYTLSIEKSRIEIEKEMQAQDLRNKGLVVTTEAFRASAAEGYRAAAAEQARAESMQKSIDVTQRTQQILEEGAATAILAATQQATASRQQITGLERLAEATAKGEAAARAVEIENRAALRTQDALAKAEASRVPELIDQAKALNDVAIAEEKRIDAAQRSIRVNQAANDNMRTVALINLETSLQGLPREQMERQIDLARTIQQLERERVDLASDGAQHLLRTVDAIGQARIRLVEAQREQQRWDDMIRSMASTVEDVLGSAFGDIFSGKKIDDWGTRLKSMLNSLASDLMRSLLIRPLFDNVSRYLSGLFAGGGGLGGLGGGLGGLGGAALAGGAGIAGGSVLVATQGGGVVNLGTLANGASLVNSSGLFGGGGGAFGGIGSWLNTNIGPSLGFALPGTGPGGIPMASSPLFGGTTLTSALGNIGLGFGAGSLLNSVLGGNTFTGMAGSALGSVAGTLLPSALGFSLGPFGGLIGGALGGLLGQFGNNRPSNFSSGAFVNLATGGIYGAASSGNAQNDQTLRQITDAISSFNKSLTKLTGGGFSQGYINPDVGTREGIQLNYSLRTQGEGKIIASSAEDAINQAKIMMIKEVENVSDTVRKVMDSVTNPDDLEAAIRFAAAYDKLSESFRDALSSLPSSVEIIGPFEQANNRLKEIFIELSGQATQFGLSLEPINTALAAATKQLQTDFANALDTAFNAAKNQGFIDDLKAIAQWQDQMSRDAAAIGLAGDQAIASRINETAYINEMAILRDRTVEELNNIVRAFQEVNPGLSELAKGLIDLANSAAIAKEENDKLLETIDLRERAFIGQNQAAGADYLNSLFTNVRQRDELVSRAMKLDLPDIANVVNASFYQLVRKTIEDKSSADLSFMAEQFRTLYPYLTELAQAQMPAAIQRESEARRTYWEELGYAKNTSLGREFLNSLGESIRSREEMYKGGEALGIGRIETQATIENITRQRWSEILKERTVEDLRLVVDAFQQLHPELALFAQELMATAKTAADATASLSEPLRQLRIALTEGDLSGKRAAVLADVANDNFMRAIAAVRAGVNEQIAPAAQAGEASIQYAMRAYGNAPQTAALRGTIISAIDSVLAARSFADGTMTTPRGMILVGERGPEWIYQPGGAMVFPAEQNTSANRNNSDLVALLRQIATLLSGGNKITQAGLGELLQAIRDDNNAPPVVYQQPRTKVA